MEGEAFVILGDTFAVFDPLGGRPAAQAVAAASRALRKSICDRPSEPKRALLEANAAINEVIQAEPTLRGIGCTAAVLSLSDAVATVAWVGDVHVLRLRCGRLEMLSREHSLRNEYARLGVIVPQDDASRGTDPSSIVVRALGMPEVEVDVATEPLAPGDLFVLLSNGVRRALGDALLSGVLTAYRGNLYECVHVLLESATANAEKDWRTVVVARVDTPGRPPVSAALSDATARDER